MTKQLPWLVVGQGALGSLMAVQLARQNQSVQLKLRQSQRVTIAYEQSSHSFTGTIGINCPSLIFAAVKAYQVAPLLDEFRQQPLFDQSQLILSYNGMLSNEAEQLRPQDWHWVTTHGAYRDGNQVVHGGHGESWLGGMAGQTTPPAFFSQLEQALPPLHFSSDINLRRWYKLAVNCLINPYTVIHQCRNGELPERVAPAEWRQVADEIVQLAAARGRQLDAEDLLAQARRVIAQTAANRSSMLQDYRLQRPLELDYLNGFVVTASAAEGMVAPANQLLCERIKAMQATRDPQ
ncbi:ketopantoate reductase family protein [Pseudidiomarina insulisalsae]|uniref:2-dehydropantoate 2-reductase n=1 Tax=Pseudidiomarina insulisalsae TaxID=575789 RepID=A0A432YEW3_9GAMM|nr:2-dehydropantoate 2-reductase [Pseudidiomarina insulisalsae]RUO59491.1 hypothetical protein CWI71_08715 [Pseudidiomarina insulisalsae]